MRMRGWGVVLVLWLGALILGSQAFAASQTLKLRQAAERRAARSLIVMEAARVSGAGVAPADSTRRAAEAEGESLVLEVVRGRPDPDGQSVRLRVLNPQGVRLQEHDIWIAAPTASLEGERSTGTDVTSAGGARLAGGSTSSSPPASHPPVAGVSRAGDALSHRAGLSSN